MIPDFLYSFFSPIGSWSSYSPIREYPLSELIVADFNDPNSVKEKASSAVDLAQNAANSVKETASSAVDAVKDKENINIFVLC